MTIPTLLFGLIFAFLIAALYHLLRGGGFWRLILYLSLSVVGFASGHQVGVWRGWTFLMIGSLNLGMATIGSITFLLIGDWLNRVEPSPQSKV